MGKLCQKRSSHGTGQARQEAAMTEMLQEEQVPDTYARGSVKDLVNQASASVHSGEAKLYSRSKGLAVDDDTRTVDLAATDDTVVVGNRTVTTIQRVRGPLGLRSRNVLSQSQVEVHQAQSQSAKLVDLKGGEKPYTLRIGSQDRVQIAIDQLTESGSFAIEKRAGSGAKVQVIGSDDAAGADVSYDSDKKTCTMRVGGKTLTFTGVDKAEDLIFATSSSAAGAGKFSDVGRLAQITEARGKKSESGGAEPGAAPTPPSPGVDAKVKELEAKLKEKDELIARQAKQLEQKDKEIAALKDAQAGQAKQISDLQDAVKQLQEAMKPKEGAKPAVPEVKPDASKPKVEVKPIVPEAPKPAVPEVKPDASKPKVEVKPMVPEAPKPAVPEVKPAAPQPGIEERESRVVALKSRGFVNEDPNYPGFLFKSIKDTGHYYYKHPESKEEFVMQPGNEGAYKVFLASEGGQVMGRVVQIRAKGADGNPGTGDLVMAKGEFDASGKWIDYSPAVLAGRGFTESSAEEFKTHGCPNWTRDLGGGAYLRYIGSSGTFVRETWKENGDNTLSLQTVHASTPDGKQRRLLWDATRYFQPAAYEKAPYFKYRMQGYVSQNWYQEDE